MYAIDNENIVPGLSRSPVPMECFGEAGDNVLIIDGIHTIDASQVKSSFLGHSYYAEARSIVSDIFAIIHTFKNPSERFALREIRHPNGRYWTFRK